MPWKISPINPQHERAEQQEEKRQERGVETRAASDLAVSLFVLTLQEPQEDRDGLQRINNGQ